MEVFGCGYLYDIRGQIYELVTLLLVCGGAFGLDWLLEKDHPIFADDLTSCYQFQEENSLIP